MSAFSIDAVRQLTAPAILDTLPDGAYITDVDRNILFWNAAAQRITGWTSPEVAGRSCNDNILVHTDKDGHELCGKEHCPLHRAIVTGQPSAAPVLVYAKHREGDRIPVEVSVSPIRDAGGTVIGGIELFRDLTEGARDLARARLIQSASLDSPRNEDARAQFAIRYTPSESVGGDFYRVERLTADRYGIMVADVMGHGIAAALYTMELRSLWEAWRREAPSPGRFMKHLNRQLRALAGDAGYFATAAYALLDVATGTADLICAGHPSPLLIRRGTAPEPVGTAQPAVGMIDDVAYRADRFSLPKGASLLLYTDGAIEAANARGEELGLDGLTRLLADHAPASLDETALAAIEEQILRFSDAIRLPDDLTLLAVTRP